jgi:hypothetical protein
LQPYDGFGPPESQSTWIARLSVYPRNCADALAHWASHEVVHDVISTAVNASANREPVTKYLSL